MRKVLAFIVILFISGCANFSTDPVQSSNSVLTPGTPPIDTTASDNYAASVNPEIVEANTQFAFNSFQKLNTEEAGNLNPKFCVNPLIFIIYSQNDIFNLIICFISHI